MNKKIIIYSIFVILTLISFFYIRSQLNSNILNGKTIKIVTIYPNSIISYDSAKKIANIKLSKYKIKKNVSLNQNISEIYQSSEYEINRGIQYIDLTNINVNELYEIIYNWRKRPQILINFFKLFLRLHTNMSFFDKITFMIETLHIKPSDIILTKSDIQEDKSNYNKSNEKITIEIVNSGLDKKSFDNILKKLKNENIDIIDKKYSSNKLPTKIIINTTENYEKAKKVMKAINIGDREVYLEKDYMYVDVKLITGNDIKGD